VGLLGAERLAIPHTCLVRGKFLIRRGEEHPRNKSFKFLLFKGFRIHCFGANQLEYLFSFKNFFSFSCHIQRPNKYPAMVKTGMATLTTKTILFSGLVKASIIDQKIAMGMPQISTPFLMTKWVFPFFLLVFQSFEDFFIILLSLTSM